MNGCGRLSTFLTADGSNKQSGFHCRAATIAVRQLMRLIHRFVFADATSCHQSESRHVLSCSPSLSLSLLFLFEHWAKGAGVPSQGEYFIFTCSRTEKWGEKKRSIHHREQTIFMSCRVRVRTFQGLSVLGEVREGGRDGGRAC